MMFTATWPQSIRRLAADFLQNAVEVRAGEADELRVNPDITQHVVFCSDMREKEEWLDKILRESDQSQCIVFDEHEAHVCPGSAPVILMQP